MIEPTVCMANGKLPVIKALWNGSPVARTRPFNPPGLGRKFATALFVEAWSMHRSRTRWDAGSTMLSGSSGEVSFIATLLRIHFLFVC